MALDRKHALAFMEDLSGATLHGALPFDTQRELLDVGFFLAALTAGTTTDGEVLPATLAEHDVLKERQKQRVKRGADHDDAHPDNALMMFGTILTLPLGGEHISIDWLRDLWMRHDYRERLVMAAAFIVAEIDRMDRQKVYARIAGKDQAEDAEAARQMDPGSRGVR